jgi:hypothetical protein
MGKREENPFSIQTLPPSQAGTDFSFKINSVLFTINLDSSLSLETESLIAKILVLFLNIQTLPLGEGTYLYSIILCMKERNEKMKQFEFALL